MDLVTGAAGVPRYSAEAFPAYAYRPGMANPHPVRDAAGHAYRGPGVAAPAFPPRLDPLRWRESRAYLFGVDLYNAGYWWEAHEEWEGLWRGEEVGSALGGYLRGMIQVAAIMLRAERLGRGATREEVAPGVERLAKRVERCFGPTLRGLAKGERVCGVELHGFWVEVRGFVEGVDRGELGRVPGVWLGGDPSDQ